MNLNINKYNTFYVTKRPQIRNIRGRQSGDDYFTVVCEMALIPKLFLFNETSIPTELRAQRLINKGRIPE